MNRNIRIVAIGAALLLLGGVGATSVLGLSAEAKKYVYTVSGGGVGGNISAKGERIKASDKISNRPVKLGSFKGVELSAGIRMEYTYNESPLQVVVRAPENLQKYVKVSIKNGLLTATIPVSYTYGSPKQCPTILVSGRGVRSFALSGGAQVLVTSTFNAGSDVSVSASGGASFQVQSGMSCDRLSLDLSGGASASLDRLTLSAVAVNSSGGASVSMEHVSATDGMGLNVSGGASMKMVDIITPKLAADCSGGASMQLSGRASEAELTASSAGVLDAGSLKVARGSVSSSSAASVVCNIKTASVSNSSMGKVKNVAK